MSVVDVEVHVEYKVDSWLEDYECRKKQETNKKTEMVKNENLNVGRWNTENRFDDGKQQSKRIYW